jgi:hypothetical protein
MPTLKVQVDHERYRVIAIKLGGHRAYVKLFAGAVSVPSV